MIIIALWDGLWFIQGRIFFFVFWRAQESPSGEFIVNMLKVPEASHFNI